MAWMTDRSQSWPSAQEIELPHVDYNSFKEFLSFLYGQLSILLHGC